MIIREGQRKVIMPDRIGGRERDRGILCAGEETETARPGAPARPRKTANPRNYLEVSCFRLSRAFETSGINSVPYYQSRVTGSTKDSRRSRENRPLSIVPLGSSRSARQSWIIAVKFRRPSRAFRKIHADKIIIVIKRSSRR